MRTTTVATEPVAPTESPELQASSPDNEPNEATAERRSRRSFVFFGALAAASLLPRSARAQGRPRPRKPVPPRAAVDAAIPPGEGVAAFNEWDLTGVSRLVRRVSMGVT